MQALFIFSIVLSSIGGATALAALFHYFSQRSRKSATLASARVDAAILTRSNETLLRELEDRERAFAEYCAKVEGELAEKRRALESLTERATRAATALSGALDSVSFVVGAPDSPRRSERVAPYRLNEFSDADASGAAL